MSPHDFGAEMHRMILDGAPCEACGLRTPIALLDAKPGPSLVDWTTETPGDFERLECPACYGPGYLPGEDRSWGSALAMAWRRTMRRNLDLLALTWRALRDAL